MGQLHSDKGSRCYRTCRNVGSACTDLSSRGGQLVPTANVSAGGVVRNDRRGRRFAVRWTRSCAGGGAGSSAPGAGGAAGLRDSRHPARRGRRENRQCSGAWSSRRSATAPARWTSARGTRTTTSATTPTTPTVSFPRCAVQSAGHGDPDSTVTLGWNGEAGATYDVLRSPDHHRHRSDVHRPGTVQEHPYLYSIRGHGATTPQNAATIG